LNSVLCHIISFYNFKRLKIERESEKGKEEQEKKKKV